MVPQWYLSSLAEKAPELGGLQAPVDPFRHAAVSVSEVGADEVRLYPSIAKPCGVCAAQVVSHSLLCTNVSESNAEGLAACSLGGEASARPTQVTLQRGDLLTQPSNLILVSLSVRPGRGQRHALVCLFGHEP